MLAYQPKKCWEGNTVLRKFYDFARIMIFSTLQKREKILSQIYSEDQKKSLFGICLRFFNFYPKKVVISKQNLHLKP